MSDLYFKPSPHQHFLSSKYKVTRQKHFTQFLRLLLFGCLAKTAFSHQTKSKAVGLYHEEILSLWLTFHGAPLLTPFFLSFFHSSAVLLLQTLLFHRVTITPPTNTVERPQVRWKTEDNRKKATRQGKGFHRLWFSQSGSEFIHRAKKSSGNSITLHVEL